MVLKKIIEILIEHLEIDPEIITVDSQLRADLGASSLDLIDIIMTIEDVFDIEVIDSEVSQIVTVADLAEYLEQKA